MNTNYAYVTWQCLLVFICGLIGLVGVSIETYLPRNIALLFTIIFIFCIGVALSFFIWIRAKIKQEKEDDLIDSIGSE